MEVGGLAQLFWTLAVGLEYKDSELIEIFNGCLDYPLPSWEMEELKTLGFWGFIDVFQYQSQSVTLGQVVPIYSMATAPEPMLKMSAKSKPSAKMATTPESPATMVVTSESPAIINTTLCPDHHEHCTGSY